MNSAEPLPLVVIEPTRGLAALRLGELWAYRELLYFLVWRDVKVRYKQTALGAAWAILQPLMTVAVFTVFFGRLAGIASDGLPYPLFSYAGLLVWTFFAQGLSQSSNSVVGSAQLITKVYFPRLVIPIAAVLSGLVDLAVALPVLAAMLWYYGIWPSLAVLTVPLLALLALVAATGVGLWLSALNVEYRDVRHVVPFLVQLWLFVTPVIYPASTLAPRLQRLGLPPWLWGINPMTGVVEGFRWAMLDAPTSPGSLIAASTVTSLALLISGVYYFRRVERSFADVV
ncbi:MAG: phosphate ABC transporter permease [Acidobacteria bacterium RBG_13_68_16]|nr:MAG: phosphate ABC transporter permease [Acidobacteria bacterium RBG_13_68_16]